MASDTRLWHGLALAWMLLVGGVGLHQVHFWRHASLDTDVMALLPADEKSPALDRVMRAMSERGEREVVVLVGARTPEQTVLAVQAARKVLDQQGSPLTPAVSASADMRSLIQFYRPWRDRLLTQSQQEWLGSASARELTGTAALRLFQPAGGGFALSDWRSDPLGLWPAWWAERAAATPARPRDGMLWADGVDWHWVVLHYASRESAFAVSAGTPLAASLVRARVAAARTVPDARLIAAGVPLHAEAAAARAKAEMNVIGWGSLLAVLVLVWLAFRSLRPIALVSLSLLVGCAAALSVTSLLFGRVHLLTLVFGASLVGVAEDYGFHYFAARQGRAASERHAILKALLPALLLALATSGVAYLALGLAPLPGLRQMAVFSVAGLLGAFLTVLCWFPLLDRNALPSTRFSRGFAGSLRNWPRWRPDSRGLVLAVLLGGVLFGGLRQLTVHDDLRQLQSSPPALLAEQAQVNRVLGLPSPAQFYLLEAGSAEQLLRREEALGARLQALVKSGTLHSYHAVSDWLPSQARQAAARELTVHAEQTALAGVAAQTGASLSRAEFASAALDVERWLAGPAAGIAGGRWLGESNGVYRSVVSLGGLEPAALPALAGAAHGLPGVQWVDQTARYSALLARYRLGMTWLLLAGYLGVFMTLIWRYRRNAWRAMLPTALGSLLTLAIFGWLGIPMQLFCVLALILLLGMGVDYGIFLLEHPGDGSAWLSVALAGVSTLLAFGLLGLSRTPALHCFGLTMLIGEVAIWFLTPCFRVRDGGAPVQLGTDASGRAQSPCGSTTTGC